MSLSDKIYYTSGILVFTAIIAIVCFMEQGCGSVYGM